MERQDVPERHGDVGLRVRDHNRHAAVGTGRTSPGGGGYLQLEAMVSGVGLTHEEVVAVWGEDNVVRVPRPHAAGLVLPARAQRVTAEIGLPRTAARLFT